MPAPLVRAVCRLVHPLVWSFLLLLSAAVEAETLRVGVYHNPPKILLDEHDRPSGIFGELLQAIATEEGWELTAVPCRWQACLEGLEEGRIDLLPDVAWSEERAETLAFHDEPVLHSWSQVFQGPDTALESMLDLDGRRVAVLEGSIQQRFLEQLAESFGIAITLQGVSSFDQGFDAARDGRVDAVVANRHYGAWQAPAYGLRSTPIMFQPARLHFAAPERLRATVLSRIDTHLREWKANRDSPYYATLGRWNVPSHDRLVIPAWLWWGLVALAGLLALALGGNLLLRRRVAERTSALAASEHRLAAILDSVEAYIFIKTPELRYAYVNRKVCELFGRSREEILGHGDEEFFDAATARQLHLTDRRVLDHDETVTREEFNVLAGGGKPHICLTVKLPLDTPDGRGRSVCGIATDITEFREIVERNRLLAYYSPLTGLPNRELLMEQLDRAIKGIQRSNRQAALLLIDLDQFKLVNDLQSHAAGDRLLQRVAHQLAETVTESDLLAHLGGDEFALLVKDLPHPTEEAALRVERLAEELLGAMQAAGESLDETAVTGSIGITLCTDSGLEPGNALQQADMALAQAKRAGGNTLRFFNEDMQLAVMARVRLEHDLQHALKRRELRLFYQRQMDGEDRTIGVEALLRWQHPERGLVSPAEFIPLAEQSRLILPIGRWVLETACRQLSQWATQPSRAHLTIAVNVSSVQFHEPDFVDQLCEVLEDTGAPPERLVLEVTESLLMEEPEQVRHTLESLRRLGIRMALDDFGTGYSSLNYLKRLPLDEVKIDRSFVTGIPGDSADAAIIETTLTLAAHLGLAVIAEGVETDAQYQWLKSSGCQGYQGYRFGRPVPVDQLGLD
ncbi:EAL domain-containing protein [Halomonas sp. C05BenzN]|uniref:EAL domain-containing protein n=1 Tax=Halomonas sp. C05BenzN TaxID=3411041 RepID=UPI003B95D59A